MAQASKTITNTKGERVKATHFILPALIASSIVCSTRGYQYDNLNDIPEPASLTTRGSVSTSATPLTINRPGSYKLTSALQASGTPGIEITADNVVLDLDGNTLTGGTNGIVVTGNHATIKNGTITNTTETGILLDGASNCHITDCDIVGSATGIVLDNAHGNSLTHINVLSATAAGFELISSCTNECTQCQASTIASNTNAYGFHATAGTGNTFIHCNVTDCSTTSGSSAHAAHGFYAVDETADTIDDCSTCNMQAFTADAHAYGIYLLNSSHCRIHANYIRATTSAATSGVGIKANSNTNQILKNYSSDNNINYQDIATRYITSQSNARGVYNIDGNLTTADGIITMDTSLNTITGDQTIIESKSDLIDSSIDRIPSQYPIEQGQTARTPQSSMTISQPGSYFLHEDIDGAITITADDVTLDLNGFTVKNSANAPTGITITGNNVTVKNGSISNMIQTGITLDGAAGCTISNCDIISSTTGILLSNAHINYLDNIRTRGQTAAGFSLVSSSTNVSHACRARTVTSTGNAYGFISENGSGNLFWECAVDQITTTSNSGTVVDVPGQAADAVSAGFWFNELEQNSSIISCNTSSCRSEQTGINQVFGIRLNEVAIGSLDTITLQHAEGLATLPHGLEWLTKNGKNYLAVVYGTQLDIYQWYDTTLTKITGHSLPTNHNTRFVAWFSTHDTTYLAVIGYPTSAPYYPIVIFEFSGEILTEIYKHEIISDSFFYAGRWLEWNDHTYLAIGSDNDNHVAQVFEFVDSNTLTFIDSVSDPDTASEDVGWIIKNTTPYLAVLGRGGSVSVTNSLFIYSFDGTALTLAETVQPAGENPLAAAWLYWNNTTYLAVVGGAGTAGFFIQVYRFNDDETLTSVDSLIPVSYSRACNWFIYGGIPYLTVGSHVSTGELRLYSFDGSTLTERAVKDLASESFETVTLLVADKPYLAMGASNQAQIYELTGSTTIQSAQDCTITHCTLHNMSAYNASLNRVNAGIGLQADGTKNYITQNTGFNNGFGLSFIDNDQAIIASQANAHGVTNIDSDRVEVDQFESKLDYILANY